MKTNNMENENAIDDILPEMEEFELDDAESTDEEDFESAVKRPLWSRW